MLLTVTLLALAAGTPDADAPSLLAAATVDRVRLPDGPAPALAVLPLRAELRLTAPGRAGALARALARKRGPCPVAKVSGDVVTLACRSHRIAAAVRRESGGLWLDLRELRGVTWDLAAGGLAAWQLSPPRCVVSAQGPSADCLLRAGALPAAMTVLEAGAKSDADWPAAALRLGDLAASEGQLEAAVKQWKRAATAAGAEGRLARARLCETSGACLTGRAADQAHSTAGLAEPQRTELEIRRIQAEVASGHLSSAARLALARAGDSRRAPLGDAARDYLLELALAALTDRATAERDDSLALYLTLRPADAHPLALPLARAAAEVSAADGAPGYAARLLSSVTQVVPQAELTAHLRRCAQLYAQSDDPVRAEMILRYARERLGKRALPAAEARRAPARPETPSGADLRRLADAADPAVDQADAVLALSRARRASAGGAP